MCAWKGWLVNNASIGFGVLDQLWLLLYTGSVFNEQRIIFHN